MNVPRRSRSRLAYRRRTAFRRAFCGDAIWLMSGFLGSLAGARERERAPSLSGATPGRLSMSIAGVPGRGSGSRRLAGDLGETSEGLCVTHRDVGQHLAIQLHTGQRHAVHELRVAHAVDPRRRVDARDPQAPEVALAVAPVAVGVGVRSEEHTSEL